MTPRLMPGNPKKAVRIYMRWTVPSGIERIPTNDWTVPYVDPEDGLWKVRKESHPEWDEKPDQWVWPVQP